jgi:hypothetical protein
MGPVARPVGANALFQVQVMVCSVRLTNVKLALVLVLIVSAG